MYGIIGHQDQYHVIGNFATLKIAEWYGNSEFGDTGYRIVRLVR